VLNVITHSAMLMVTGCLVLWWFVNFLFPSFKHISYRQCHMTSQVHNLNFLMFKDSYFSPVIFLSKYKDHIHMLFRMLDFTVHIYIFCGLVTLTFDLSASNMHHYYTRATGNISTTSKILFFSYSARHDRRRNKMTI